MRKIQTNYEKFPTHFISCMGDSITQNYIWGPKPHEYYPAVLQELLKNEGCAVTCRNFGISGNTTTQMLARFSSMTQYEIPDIAVIFAVSNAVPSLIPP